MPGNLPGTGDTAGNKTGSPAVWSLWGWGEADNKQRNNKDVFQVVIRATAENKAGGGDTREWRCAGGEGRAEGLPGGCVAEEAAEPTLPPPAGCVSGMLEEQKAGWCGWSRGSQGRALAGRGGGSVRFRPSRAS